MSRLALLALTVGVAACTSFTAAHAQEPGTGPGPMHRGMGGCMMSAEHQQMHEQMQQQMRAHDAKLDELVAAMNQAEGPARVDAIAAVVNELIAQRREMRAHREQMSQLRGACPMACSDPATTP